MCLMSESAAPSERPLRRDAERNRQRILEAAHVVFAERGLSGSHADIAREAGVGVGTVWRRGMTIVFDGLRAECARSELVTPALDQEQTDAVMASYGRTRRRT